MQRAGERHGLLAGETLRDERELVAADAGDRLAGAGRQLQPLRDLDQQLVADGVPERVVDELELVHVEQDHRRAAAVSLAPGDRLRQPVEEERPVQQPGQLVVERPASELLLERVALGRVARDPPEVQRRALRLDEVAADLDEHATAVLRLELQLDRLVDPVEARREHLGPLPVAGPDDVVDAHPEQLLAAVAGNAHRL